MTNRLALVVWIAAAGLGSSGTLAAAAPAAAAGQAVALAQSAASAQFDVSTPVGVLQESAAAFQENDVDRLLRASLSERMYQTLRTELETATPPSESASQAFAKNLEQWTAPDAVDQAMVQLQPMIAGLKPQVQAAIAGLPALIATLPPDQQPQAQAVVEGLAAWAESNAFDAAQVRAALTVLQQTLIDLELESLEAMNAQPYDLKVANLGLVLAGIKAALVEFDLDLDGIFASMTFAPGTESGTNATVNAGVTLFGARIEGALPVVQVDGRWLSPIGAAGLVTYNDYLSRAQVAEAAAASGAVKTAITEHYAALGEMPEAGRFDAADAGRYSGVSHDADGVITVTLHNDRPVNTQVRGYQLTLTPQVEDGMITGWTCAASAGANRKYLPGSCR